MTAPRATYRLQLHAGFDFHQARAVVPYLAQLGVSHLYLSPILQAAEGSTHGYDVVDPDRISEALGGEGAFEQLVDAANQAGLGILLDIVPNHMSIAGARNRWWFDVLENGPASYYAGFFDVDWTGPGVTDDRVLLPVLGDRYGRSLASGLLQIAHDRHAFTIRAGELKFPMSPRSIGAIVRRAGERIHHLELQFIGDGLCELSRDRQPQREDRRRRQRDKAVLSQRLRMIYDEPTCAKAIDDEVAAINGDAAELDTVLEAQHYRLAHWTVAQSQLGYRRFFDINTLVGIRNEDPDVFAASHNKVLELLGRAAIDGVRIDHVDGLREPATYLARLREAAPDAWIVVEKILAHDEALPDAWPIEGTTGYEYIEKVVPLLVDRGGEQALTETFEAYTVQSFDPVAESRRARLEVMSDALHSELVRLTELGARACAQSPACRDYTRAEIETTLAEILAGYPSYRTYFGEDVAVDPRYRGAPSAHAERAPTDRERIAHAVAAAAAARPDLDRDLLAFFEAALAFELPSVEARELAKTAQQVTGAIIAKGDEDTLLYRQVRLLARCEVGCHLETFAAEPRAVHHRLALGRPRSLLALSTHDTKRGEDVRARIAVLSELPAEWSEAVTRWRERARDGWGDVAPDPVFEYAMWQTLVGAWPLPIERAKTWAQKATKEARLRTSWRQPDPAYEAARDRWLEHVYGDRELVEDLGRFAARLAPHGDRNALAQTLIKLTAPGVPDFYQGTELRDDSLVDPDNRRAVDFTTRARMLGELDVPVEKLPEGLAAAKLWMIRRVLGLRRSEPSWFEGAYEPLAAIGAHAHRVFAFARGGMPPALVTVVPRLGVAADGWRDTTLELPHGTWRDVLSDRTHAGIAPIAELWRAFPVALLVRAS
ncbi:MAG TPA: malto-oligosyltrehalose synthase [Kofleriaceae bacterium]|nr:malto-oligosyltrehalose synthase [Kofleriaceae bacterium]